MRLLLKPQLVLPVLLATALLLFAFSLGNLNDVARRVGKLPMRVLWLALAAAACYLACKAAQLKLMLTQVDERIPARPFWLAFAVGELAITLPMGLFSQNWVLSASLRVHIDRSSAATVMMALAEIAVVFLYLAVVGIRGWPATRPLAVAVLTVVALLLLGLLLFETAGAHASFQAAPPLGATRRKCTPTFRRPSRTPDCAPVDLSIRLPSCTSGINSHAAACAGRVPRYAR